MCDDVSAAEIESALLNGVLPAYFAKQVRAESTSDRKNSYLTEMLRRDVKGIKWDVQILNRLSGKA